MAGGNDGEDAVLIGRALKAAGVDIVHVSTGFTSSEQKPVFGRMWQTRFADQVRNEADVPTKNGYPFPGPTMHVTNWPPMPWTSFSIELNTAHSTDEMWIDELALDTKRIGCRR